MEASGQNQGSELVGRLVYGLWFGTVLGLVSHVLRPEGFKSPLVWVFGVGAVGMWLLYGPMMRLERWGNAKMEAGRAKMTSEERRKDKITRYCAVGGVLCFMVVFSFADQPIAKMARAQVVILTGLLVMAGYKRWREKRVEGESRN